MLVFMEKTLLESIKHDKEQFVSSADTQRRTLAFSRYL